MSEKTTRKKMRSGFRPLVTADPQDNLSTALNLFYVKDGWTWVRGGGPGPDYADVSLCDYIRRIAKEHNLDIAQSDDDDSISLEMSELLFDGTDTIEGIVAALYTAGWAFAELRQRLKAYEDTRLYPEEVAALVASPNDPLPLDELREMARTGLAVWCLDTDGINQGLLCMRKNWSDSLITPHVCFIDEEGNSGVYPVELMWKMGARFYHRKPEEGTA